MVRRGVKLDPNRPIRKQRGPGLPTARLPARAVPDKKWGPAMSILSEPQRCFVLAYLDLGARHGSATEAARVAGYGGSDSTTKAAGYSLIHNPRVLAAIHEEAENLYRQGSLRAALVMSDLLEHASDKIKFQAAKDILDRTQVLPKVMQHKLTVEAKEQSTEELQAFIAKSLAKLNASELKALGLEKPVVDAEWTEVGAGDERKESVEEAPAPICAPEGQADVLAVRPEGDAGGGISGSCMAEVEGRTDNQGEPSAGAQEMQPDSRGFDAPG